MRLRARPVVLQHRVTWHSAALEHLGVRGDRRRAACVERAEKDALGERRRSGAWIVDRGEELEPPLVARAALHGERPLAGRREHGLEGKPLGDLALEPQPPDSGRREDRGIELAFAHLADSRVHVSANGADLGIRPERT